jgi:hypothetical protein
MTDATTEDHTHDMPHYDLPELPEIPHIPLSDLEQILQIQSSQSAAGEAKAVNESERRRLLGGRISPPSFLDMPR